MTTKTTEPRGCPTPGACSALVEIERLRTALTEIARLGVDMRSDFSRSAMQSKIAREALKDV